jgi:ATP-dependent Lon protease
VSLTGELTLTGKVLPIGGLKEKTLAAHRAKIRHIIIPRDNEKDIAEIPETIRNELTFHPVAHVDEVIDLAFEKPVMKGKKKTAKSKTKKTSRAPAKRAPATTTLN